jgi:hypothetical protein
VQTYSSSANFSWMARRLVTTIIVFSG